MESSSQPTHSFAHKDSNRLSDEQDIDTNMLEDVQIVEELDETGTQKESTKRVTKRQKGDGQTKSVHWQGFTVVWMEECDPPVKTRKGRCKRCNALIAVSNRTGTNGLKNHFASCSRKNPTTEGGQTILNYTASGVGGSGTLTSWKFDQKAIRLALCEMIILDELPFLFVEHEGFKKFIDRACPQFQIPSRKTIRQDCVKLFLEHKEGLKSFFQKKGMGRVSITTDCWTVVNNTNFICVTAHCISKDWILHKKIISFCKIESHKGTYIGEMVVQSLKEWGLTNVICCTMDNASANDGVVRCVKSYLVDTLKTDVLSGNYLHMRCAAHILNLVVKDGLDEIGMSVRRVKEAVKWIKASPARSSQFFNYVNVLKDRISSKKSLCLDVPTRWNSTYLMLESAQVYEEVFKMCGGMFVTYTNDLNQRKHNDLPIGPPEATDWANVKKIIEYLKKFYELTLLVSGSTYTTSHLFFVEMCDVFDLITELEQNDDYEVSSMAIKMRIKIGKYWLEEIESNNNMNRLLYIAVVLDPRQNMKHEEKCFKSLYGAQRAVTLVSEVASSMNELFEFYKKAQTQRVTPTPPARTTNTSTPVPSYGRSDHRGALSLLAMHDSDDESEESDTNELTIYLAEKQHKVAKTEIDQFDILQWWSKNTPRYPVMAEMARDILAIPISSVASEAAFSTGGRILSAYRSSLTPNMVEALICAEDWLWTSIRCSKNEEESVPEQELIEEFEFVLSNIGLGQTTMVQTAQNQSGSPN